MSRAGPAPSRRVQAYAYTTVTTAVVLLFAVAEWASERFLSERSRAASTAVELFIVLLATLVFRPIHRKTEALVEAAFYKRRRQALAALQKFRRELHSFKDIEQLLRRVIEAVDHHLEARASAVYLRRDAFRPEASSFDVQAESVPFDDPLAIRLRSSAAPARPPLLKSRACGTHAFAMTVAGDLVGFLTTQCPHGDYDAEESNMLAGLAQDLGAAVVALDPRLRSSKRRIPNNIPADLTVLVGRERELAEIKAALAQSRLVTLTGAGGVGKTSLALQCAAQEIDAHDDGAWFVSLSPITDPALVPATMLAALEAAAPDQEDETARLIEHLRVRDALIVIDNCEQVLTAVTSLVARIRAHCPHIRILATSRELLHLDGEQVYRLGALRTDAAVELFANRAVAVSPAFEPHNHTQTIRNICEHLDGIPLAIELAASRVRALSVDDILARLSERFRLLTGGARTAEPRQQTLARAIEWSYDLLSHEEQSLFRHLAAFRGSFSLAGATAVCEHDARCDEFHVLDLLTSLADRSLVGVTLGVSTRYRLLETIREFAAHKMVEHQATEIVARQHASYFAQLAAQAYHEFDTHLPHGWLDRLAPDIDNFRAALEFTLVSGGDPLTGAQLAADCGPVFLRMQLLPEGLRWCEAARGVSGVPNATAGRIDYVASMMHNNLGENRGALACAERAVAFYEQSPDERGLIRALSQVAQVHSRMHHYEQAQVPAAEAIRRARLLNEPRVLASVLRRCAYSLPPERIDEARALFAEALQTARSRSDLEEACLILEWWAHREARVEEFARAIGLAEEALACAGHDTRLVLENSIACWALAEGDFGEAAPHARNALALVLDVQYPLGRALTMAYCAPLIADDDPEAGAMLFGYARARLDELEWEAEGADLAALENVSQRIEKALTAGDYRALLARGAAWGEPEALAIVTRCLSSSAAEPSAAALHS